MREVTSPIQLLSCPICGATAKMHSTFPTYMNGSYHFIVSCEGKTNECWCKTHWYKIQKDAANAWNSGKVKCLQCGGSGRSEVGSRCYICSGTGNKRMEREGAHD